MELNDVLTALHNADAAGNVEDATQLAQLARQMGVGAPPPAPAPAAPPPSKAGFFESAGAGLAGGLANTGLGAAAAASSLVGANETADSLDARRKAVEEWQQRHGGDTTTGKIANMVGGLAPAALEVAAAPLTGGSSLLPLVANAGLFALPAFRDTYKEQLAAGASKDVAIEHALANSGMALVGGQIVGRAGKVLGAGEGMIGQMGKAAVEGAAFDAASTAGNKLIDAANGRQTDQPWVDPKSMAENAAAFGLLRGVTHPMEASQQAKIKAQQDALKAQQDAANKPPPPDTESPEYAKSVQEKYLAAEQAYQQMRAQIIKIDKNSPTYAADIEHNKLISPQLKDLAAQRAALAPEFARLRAAGKFGQPETATVGQPGEEAPNVSTPAPFKMPAADAQHEMFSETGGQVAGSQRAQQEQERAAQNKGPQVVGHAPDGSPIFEHANPNTPKDGAAAEDDRLGQLMRNLRALGGMDNPEGTGKIPGLLQDYQQRAMEATDPKDIAKWSRLHNETLEHVRNAYDEINKLHADQNTAPTPPKQSPLAEDHVGLLGQLDDAKKAGDMGAVQKAAEALQKNVEAGGKSEQDAYLQQLLSFQQAQAYEAANAGKQTEGMPTKDLFGSESQNAYSMRKSGEEATANGPAQESGEAYEGEHGRNERENAEHVARAQADARGTDRTVQGRLFDNEQASGSTVVSGAGGPSEKTIPELQAELQVARATGNKSAARDAVARLRDAQERAKNKPAQEAASPIDTGAKNLAEVLGTGKTPAKLKAVQAAREQRNVAYGKLVSLLDRFNKGKAKQGEVDEAVKNVLDGLVSEINAGRDTPLTEQQEKDVRREAYVEHLRDLINRFGDTRNLIDRGTPEKPFVLPAQAGNGEWNRGQRPEYAPGFPTIESAEPGRQTFGNRHAAVLSIREGLDNLRNKAVGQGTMEARDETLTPAHTTPEALAGEVAAARPETPEQRALLERIKDELPALSNHTSADEARTAQVQMNGPGRDGTPLTRTATEQSRGTRAADDVAAWLHSLRIGTEDEQAKQAVIDHLARLEAGKRSDTENPTRTRETAWGTARGEEKPVNRAEQGDLFDAVGMKHPKPANPATADKYAGDHPAANKPPPFKDQTVNGKPVASDRAPVTRGTVFDSVVDFFKYLGSEGLRVARQMAGVTTPSIHQAMRLIEPLQGRIDELTKSMDSMQAEYDRRSAEIKTRNEAALAAAKGNARQAASLMMEQRAAQQRAEAEHDAAKKRLEDVRAQLSKELLPARIRLQNAHDAFAESVDWRDNLQETIQANADKYKALNAQGLDLVHNLMRRQQEMRIVLHRDATHENYTIARKLQRDMADLTERLVAHKEALPEAAQRFLERDAQLQKQLVEEIDNLHQAHTELETAEQALKKLQRNQARRVGEPRAEAEVEGARQKVLEQEKETGAAAKIKAEADREVEAHAAKLRGNPEEGLAAEHERHSPDLADKLGAQSNEKQELEKKKQALLAPALEQQAARGKESGETHGAAKAASNARTAERNAFLERLGKMPTMRVMFDALQKARESISGDRKARVIAAMEQLEPSDASYKKYQTELNKIERAERYLADRDGAEDNADRLAMEEERERLIQKTIPAGEEAARKATGKARTEKVKLLNENRRRLEQLDKILSKQQAGVKEHLQTPEERRKAAEEYLTADHLLSLEDRGTTKGVAGTETAPLKPGRVSQASKKEVMAGDQRTSSQESKQGENKVGGRNPTQEERKPNERNTKVSGREQREANEEAEALKPAREDTSRTPAEKLQDIAEQKVADLNRKLADARERQTAYANLDVSKQVTEVVKKLGKEVASLEAELGRARDDAAAAKKNAEAAAEKSTAGAARPTDAQAEELRKSEEERKAAEAAKAAKAANKPSASRGATPVSAAAREAAHDGRLMDVAADLAKNGSTPEVRAAAAKLQPLLLRTKLSVDANVTHNGESVAGLYDPGANHITMHPEGLTEEDLLHEMSHAATDRVLLETDPAKLTPDQRKARASLEGLRKMVMGNAAFKGEHGLTSTREFAAEVYSNPEFRAKLDAFGKPLSILDHVKNLFRRLLGMDPITPGGNAKDLVDRILKPSAKINGSATPSIFRGPAKYDDRLKAAGALAERTIATQRPMSEKLKGNAWGRAALEFETKMVDGLAGVKRHADKMDPLAGTQVRYFLAMANQRMNLLGQAVGRGFPSLNKLTRADGRNEWLYESKDGSPNLMDVAKTLRDANKLTGGDEATNNLFSLYEVGKRAGTVGLERLNYGGEVTQADLNSAMAEIKAVPGLKDIFDKASDQYRAFNQDAVKFGISTGAFSQELGTKMLANKDYVPYYRENSDGSVSMLMGSEEITKVGNVKDQPYLHELVGGDQRILDFGTSAVRNANMILDMGLRNQATKNTAMELQKIGLADVKSGDRRAGPNTLHFKVDGVPHFAVVHDTPEVPAELLVKGMAGLPVQQSALLKMAGAPSRLLRHMFVANPLSAPRILFKDTLSSAMVAGVNLNSLGKALKEVGGNLMERRGISGGEVFTGLPQDLTNIYRQMQSGKPGWENLLAKANTLHAKADAMTRQIRYGDYKKQGLSDMEASYMALESMNFTKRGISPSIHILNTLNPFINSQIQGINTLVKAARGNMPMNDRLQIRQKLFQRGMMVAGGTILYSMLQQDDPAYQNATPEQKYNNFFMRVPGMDEPLRIPIPFEAGMLFKSVPEAMVNYAMGNDKDAAAGMRQLAQRIVPGGDTDGIPQVLRPAIEVATNHSFFTGRSLETRHESTLSPEARVRDNTSGFAEALGKAYGVSPVMVDHLIGGYTGQIGLAVSQIASSLVFGEHAGAPAPLASQEPITGSLWQPQDAGAVVEQAYQMATEAQQVSNTVQDLAKKGRPEAAQAFLEQHADAYARSQIASKFTSTMSELQKAENAVRASGMTPEEKRDKIQQLRAKRTDIAKQVLNAAGTARPSAP